MLATIKTLNPVRALVRRNHRDELIQIPSEAKQPELRKLYSDLRLGERVIVSRRTNSPYLILEGRA
jgi:hypothetical protein